MQFANEPPQRPPMRMRIGILGSWKRDFGEWRLNGTVKDFEAACHDLGRALARHRLPVILGGHSPRTADAHVVEGILEIAKDVVLETPLIEVLRPADAETPYNDLATTHPHLFRFHQVVYREWAVTHLLTVRESDCVLAIGGHDRTYHAGLAAIVARKPLIPIASFGGAAARLLHDLRALGSDVTTTNELLDLNAPWNPAVLSAVQRLAGIGRKPRIMLIHGQAPDRHELESWLHRHAELAEVRVMQNEFSPGHLIPQKLEQLAAWADGAIALATPDDEGGPADEKPSLRARQNVWVEVGWFWGRLGRKRILLLRKGAVEIPSDLQGLLYSAYSDAPSERAEQIRVFLERLRGYHGST